ncbi:hypothetical protein P2318_32880 [Myxococcaceae bacterium GXIMD 01537]
MAGNTPFQLRTQYTHFGDVRSQVLPLDDRFQVRALGRAGLYAQRERLTDGGGGGARVPRVDFDLKPDCCGRRRGRSLHQRTLGPSPGMAEDTCRA